MHRPTARALVGGAAALTLLTAGPVVAADRDDRGRGSDRAARTTTYALPGTNVFPEGVDTFGRFFYVTSTTSGAVFRGVIGSSDTAELFLPGGQDGRTAAVGIEATEDLLVVAGGATGDVSVYDGESGRFLASHTVTGGAPTFINDIAVAPNGDVYATDSARDAVYRIPAGEVEASSELEVFAAFVGVDPTGPFNANGIVVTKDGRYLVVVQSDTGRLFRVATSDGLIREIDLGGATVTAGDGLEIQGRTLYVVRNRFELITEVRLDGRLTRGTVVDETTDPTFQFPTTAALDRGRLLVVNSQFDRRIPGTTVGDFTVSSIKRP
ncbi:MAG: superoxide dismutase [Actinomycetota bacterium]|nr:superoxide dismutase [Actinomycetota bacterium]